MAQVVFVKADHIEIEVAKLLVELGAACSEYLDKTLVNLNSKRIQCDEIWQYVGAKDKNVPFEKRDQFGIGDWIEVPVYRMDTLPAGHEVKGPAILESATTTVLVREGERVTVTPHGWLDIRIG